MKFNHFIEINNSSLSLPDMLTHTQLWRGLVLRAEAPKLFVPYLDECAITARDDTGFARKLRYGEVVICDVVTLTAKQKIHYAVPAQQKILPSSLTVIIEEPQPKVFFVRFTYDDSQSEEANSTDEFYNAFRRSAYQEADIDTIRIIRQMAQDGRLDALPSCY